MSINSVSKVGHVDFGGGVIQIETPQPAETSTVEEKPVEQKTADTKSSPVMNGNVHLKFVVDQKTNDVTVLVLDRANRQVIRTIPTDELANLSRGDLVEVFA